MGNSFFSILIVVSLLISINSLGQERGMTPFVSSELPDDLPESTILFFLYDSLDVNPEMDKKRFNEYNKRNKKFAIYNLKIRENVRLYPYAYVLTYRSQIKSYHQEGVKYYFDSDMSMNYNNGVLNLSLGSGEKGQEREDFYIKNLDSGDYYGGIRLLGTTNVLSIDYGYQVKHLVKKVKREIK